MGTDEMLGMVENFLLRKWPYAGEVCLVALIFTGCLKVRKADPDKKMHPVHDFVHTFLNTFATGVVGPLLVGETPLPLVNDAIFTLLIVIWLLFYRFDKYLVPFASTTGVYQVLVFFATLSRANNVCVFTDKAFKRISKVGFTPRFYPVPLLGPIIVGLMRGAGGLFFPPDKGLGGLKAGAPFNAQIAIVCATLWHLAVNDPYVIGGATRGALQLATANYIKPTPTGLKCVIVVFFLVMNVLQSFKTYSTVNPFSPLWELLYMATGIQRSPGAAPPRSFKGLYDLHLRRKTELAFDLTKGAFVIGAMTAVVYQWLPNDTLHAGQVLRQGDYIGACTLAPSLRKCTPTVAVVEPGRVAVYKGKHPTDEAKELLWASAKKEQPAKSADGWVAVVREDGTLALQDGADARKPAWASKLSGAARRARSFMVRAVVEDGELALYRSGVRAWSSKSA